MNGYTRYLPWTIVGLAALFLVGLMIAPAVSEGQFRFDEAARIPVVENGRVKPLDTVARNSLMVISSRQSYTDEADHTQPAIRWLLDVMTSQLAEEGKAEKAKVFRIENDQVLAMLGLDPRPGFRYSISEFLKKMPELQERAERVSEIDAKQRDLVDQKVFELAQHLQLYINLAQFKTPHVVPPAQAGGDWQRLLEAVAESRQTGQDNKDARDFGGILVAYAKGDVKEFNQAVKDYQQKLTGRLHEDVDKADFEVFFNRFAPFYNCSLLYVGVFLLACFGLLGFSPQLNRAALALAMLTLVVHTWALIARMYIQDRPPVTNLYSSAVFIGWACVIFGIGLEALYRNGIGNLVAATTGALTLLVAHNLASGGDTLEMMQAVLDTNFWLATHVTCVTIGYSATFMAGFLGILLILRGVFTRSLNTDEYRTMGQMIYGVVCFGMFFSFVGTVLGGIWADQSWGRFWGWDPKENGALLIVLWNALILHARWGGMVKQRGMATLAVGGNIVTAWSWFGVNMLGVGLHSYGFMSGAVFWLVSFVVSQLFIIGFGLLPLRYWRSFAAANMQQPKRPASGSRNQHEAPALATSK